MLHNRFTSGTWKVVGVPYDDLDDPYIVAVQEDGTEIYIAQTVYDMQDVTCVHNIDNDTYLLAASKDLLEAYEDLMDGIMGLPPLSAIEGVLIPQFTKAQKAVRKAYGYT